MPEIVEALEAAGTPISVLTKSPLVLRDIDLYARMAKRVDVSVNLSVPTLDEKAWRATEPHTPSPRARLEAVAKLKERGIGSGVLIAPLMPGHQRLARAGRADRRAGPRGRRRLPRRRRPAPARRGARRLLRLAAGQAPRPAARGTSGSTRGPRLHAPRGPQARLLGRSGAGAERRRRSSATTAQAGAARPPECARATPEERPRRVVAPSAGPQPLLISGRPSGRVARCPPRRTAP